MTISDRVKSQFFKNEEQVIRLAPSNPQHTAPTKRNGKPWSVDEHNRFLEALEQYPSGPWKVVASYVGTRTTRQTMTHAQKYRERIARKKRDDEFGSMSEFASATTAAVATATAAAATAAASHASDMGATPASGSEMQITALELERFDETLLPLFQSSNPPLSMFEHLDDDLDDEFIEECLNHLVRHEQDADGAHS